MRDYKVRDDNFNVESKEAIMCNTVIRVQRVQLSLDMDKFSLESYKSCSDELGKRSVLQARQGKGRKLSRKKTSSNSLLMKS